MKQVFLVAFIAILSISCGSSNSQSIEGKWVLQDMEFQIPGEASNEASKSFIDAMKKELIGKLSLEFKADKTFISITPFGGKTKTEEGTWAISDDKKTISTTSDKEQKDFTIDSLDGDVLVLSLKDGQGSSIMTFKSE